MEINNYKLKEFLQQSPELIEEYSTILTLSNPTPTKHNLQDLKFSEVEFVKQNLGKEDALEEVFDLMDNSELLEIKVVQFYGKLNFIKEQLEQVVRVEEEHLTSKHTDFKWEAVEGSKRLSGLGILPLVDSLAQGDILKYDEILNLPYTTVLKKLILDTLKSDIQKDMDKIKTNS
jgi:hypothetical protein